MHAQIQTYATCTSETLAERIQSFGEALDELGCRDPKVLSWVDAVSWPEDEDDSFGDVYAAPITLTPADADPLTIAGIEISIYTTSAAHSLEDIPPWLGINLLLDDGDLRQSKIEPYAAGRGQSIWKTLRVLARHFPEIGAYFTEDWQDNQVWRAILEGSARPWIFEAGIFPRALADRFQEVPHGFQGTVTEEGFGFAQTNRWQKLPWEG